ncbi:hypothetical protein [Sorangium sp. So ce388]
MHLLRWATMGNDGRRWATVNYAMLQVPDGGAPKPPPAGVAEHAGPAGDG